MKEFAEKHNIDVDDETQMSIYLKKFSNNNFYINNIGLFERITAHEFLCGYKGEELRLDYYKGLIQLKSFYKKNRISLSL